MEKLGWKKPYYFIGAPCHSTGITIVGARLVGGPHPFLAPYDDQLIRSLPNTRKKIQLRKSNLLTLRVTFFFQELFNSWIWTTETIRNTKWILTENIRDAILYVCVILVGYCYVFNDGYWERREGFTCVHVDSFNVKATFGLHESRHDLIYLVVEPPIWKNMR